MPAVAVIDWPCWAVPEIAGSVEFDGAALDTVGVAVETAVALPAEFDAVTATTSVEPTSADVAE